MSDGDHATPGRPDSPEPNRDNEWLTRSARPTPGAAPWERGTDSTDADADIPAPRRSDDESAPITVADLIAKIHGEAPIPEPTRHRAEPEPEPEFLPEPEPEPYPTDELDTTILPALDARPSELPNLTA